MCDNKVDVQNAIEDEEILWKPQEAVIDGNANALVESEEILWKPQDANTLVEGEDILLSQ